MELLEVLVYEKEEIQKGRKAEKDPKEGRKIKENFENGPKTATDKELCLRRTFHMFLSLVFQSEGQVVILDV
jgi:hypothetical protein